LATWVIRQEGRDWHACEIWKHLAKGFSCSTLEGSPNLSLMTKRVKLYMIRTYVSQRQGLRCFRSFGQVLGDQERGAKGYEQKWRKHVALTKVGSCKVVTCSILYLSAYPIQGKTFKYWPFTLRYYLCLWGVILPICLMPSPFG
jgi:hypothetical protein